MVFDVRVVVQVELESGGGVVPHAFDNEAMKAIAGPSVTDAQGFEDDEFLAELRAVLACAIQRGVVSEAPRRSHPVQHKWAIELHGR